MLNLTISFDDPIERMLYGDPDPYLALFECRHDVGYQHFHNEVNPPTGPTGPEPPDPPDPPDTSDTSTPSTPTPDPDPPSSEPTPEQIAEWQNRHETGSPSDSLEESLWRGQQAGREAEARSRDNPAMARVEQSGVERQLRQDEIDHERFGAAPDYDVEQGLHQLYELTDRAPTDPDADWYDQLVELYETYADAWEDSGLSDTRLTDGQGNTFTLGEYLAEQRSRLDVRRTLSRLDAILSTTDEGDVTALQALADDPATADLPVTVTGPDGKPVQTTVGDYITNTLIPHTQTRLDTNRALGSVNEITETADAGDIEALQLLADDPATADLPITVKGPDGEPVQTTVGDYITNTLIPHTQTRLDTNTALGSVNEITVTADAGDIEALQLLADDPATADLPITVKGPDGKPVQTTVGDYLNNILIPSTQKRLTIDHMNDITETIETGDVEALQAIADDPEQADIVITVTGGDGESKQITVGDYIKNTLLPHIQNIQTRTPTRTVEDLHAEAISNYDHWRNLRREARGETEAEYDARLDAHIKSAVNYFNARKADGRLSPDAEITLDILTASVANRFGSGSAYYGFLRKGRNPWKVQVARALQSGRHGDEVKTLADGYTEFDMAGI